MNKKIYLFIGFLSCLSFATQAQTQNDFYDDLIVSEEIKIEDKSNLAKDKAKDLLQSKPQTLKIKGLPATRPAPKSVIPSSPSKNAKITPPLYGNAPFGLAWGISISETQNMGVKLEPIEEKDYVNNFLASSLPQGVKDFRDIVLTFGEENKLWRILAYSNFIDDTPEASKVLYLYNRYYVLLGQKYGHAQQFFTPKIVNVDIKGTNTQTTETHAIGNPQFLSELQSGEASLYSTFENNKVGAALSVNVDGDGRSYLIIDYKNLEIMRNRDNKIMNAL